MTKDEEFSTPKDILDEMGGVDGFFRYMELTGPIELACEDMLDLLRKTERSGRFELEDYIAGKSILVKISRANYSLALKVAALDPLPAC